MHFAFESRKTCLEDMHFREQSMYFIVWLRECAEGRLTGGGWESTLISAFARTGAQQAAAAGVGPSVNLIKFVCFSENEHP